ncbi:MAG TPA: hypothetical protein VFY89_10835 [Ktedonobacterales bacterium]
MKKRILLLMAIGGALAYVGIVRPRLPRWRAANAEVRRAEGRDEPGTRRFLDRVRQFNKRALNPMVLALTKRLSGGYAIIQHTGRRSGKRYATPVVGIPTAEGFAIPLPYGADTDWCRNVLAAGGCAIQWKGETYQVSEPQVLDLASAGPILPSPYRWLLPLVRIRQVVRVRRVPLGDARSLTPERALPTEPR